MNKIRIFLLLCLLLIVLFIFQPPQFIAKAQPVSLYDQVTDEEYRIYAYLSRKALIDEQYCVHDETITFQGSLSNIRILLAENDVPLLAINSICSEVSAKYRKVYKLKRPRNVFVSLCPKAQCGLDVSRVAFDSSRRYAILIMDTACCTGDTFCEPHPELVILEKNNNVWTFIKRMWV